MANKVLKLNQFMKVLKKAPPKVIEKPINQEKHADTSDIIRQLKDFMSNKSNVVDAPVEKTELNDEESNNVMDYILYYKNKYFPTIDLSQEIVKNFIYNIPHDVYPNIRMQLIMVRKYWIRLYYLLHSVLMIVNLYMVSSYHV